MSSKPSSASSSTSMKNAQGVNGQTKRPFQPRKSNSSGTKLTSMNPSSTKPFQVEGLTKATIEEDKTRKRCRVMMDTLLKLEKESVDNEEVQRVVDKNLKKWPQENSEHLASTSSAVSQMAELRKGSAQNKEPSPAISKSRNGTPRPDEQHITRTPEKTVRDNKNVDAESEDDNDDDDEEDKGFEDTQIKAPNELLEEFLVYVMQKKWADAHKLCSFILLYEPHNATAKEYLPLIEYKLGESDDDSDESDSDDDSSDDSDEDSDDSYSDDSDDDSSSDDSDNDDKTTTADTATGTRQRSPKLKLDDLRHDDDDDVQISGRRHVPYPKESTSNSKVHKDQSGAKSKKP